MEKQYSTLQTLSTIVQEMSQPTQYRCTPREMILHSTFDWELIQKHLTQLQEEGFVEISKADTLQFSITEKGFSFIENERSLPVKELGITCMEKSID
jgi:predicted transcriptional regulator